MTLLRHGGKVFCVDAMCSHMGGPLHEGDIEDMPDGSSCIKCPWHSFRVRSIRNCCIEERLADSAAEVSRQISLQLACEHSATVARNCRFAPQFDLASGCRLEKGLCPSEVLRSEPQQRTHPVYNDGDWIWCVAC